MERIRVGPARCPSRESPEHAVELLLERGYTACELDLESGFWLDYPWAERLEQKERAVAFGIEVMGRISELGSIDDVLEIAARVPWARPVVDFAHMHATSDGAFMEVDAFAAVLEGADGVLEPGAPFHVHFSDIAYANRNETKHLPYGDGTLRAEPLRDALARFERPATVISESPDEASSQAIKAVLQAGASAAS